MRQWYKQHCIKRTPVREELNSTIEREFAPLLQIKDNYPKYLITMDKTWKDNIEGVKHFYIADFLLMDKWK